MTYRTVQESEFRERIRLSLQGISAKAVTGPGRSGAVAAVYASHILGVPFIPYRQPVPDKLHPVLVIDTAAWTGATIRKAQRLYGPDAKMLTVYHEPPMVRFWYEAKAQNLIDRRGSPSAATGSDGSLSVRDVGLRTHYQPETRSGLNEASKCSFAASTATPTTRRSINSGE